LNISLNNTTEYFDTTTQLGGVKTRIRKFSDTVRTELEAAFLIKNFISGAEKFELAKRLGLTERQVQKWFVHRREKLRRLEKKAATLNSPLDIREHGNNTSVHHSQIRSAANILPNIDYSKPKLASKSLNENPYQKVYHNYRQIKTEQKFNTNNLDENNVDVEGNCLNEADDLDENEYYDQNDEENNWNNTNNNNNNDDDDDFNNNNQNAEEEQNFASEDLEYASNTVNNQTYDYQENSDYLNDFESKFKKFLIQF
jgi:hypothetical protein